MSAVLDSVGTSGARAVDFEIHGILRVRTLGARARDLAAVARDLGPPAGEQGGRPDVIVHFVDDLSPGVQILPKGDRSGDGAGGTPFFDPSGRTPIAWVSRGESWGEARIVCVRGLESVPLLSASRDLAAVRRGWVPLHGSAWVTREGVGVLVTGSGGSGKTGALLAALEAGASPVGDDRIMLSADGSCMVGLARPVTVKDWHLAQLRLPGIGPRTVRRALARACLGLSGRIARHGSRRGHWGRRAVRRFGRALTLEVQPGALAEHFAPLGSTRPHMLIILEAHRYPGMVAAPIDQPTAARQIAAQVDSELEPALRAHASCERHHPGRGWVEAQRAPERAAGMLREATQSIPTFLVRHPHPCSLKELQGVVGTLEEHLAQRVTS